MSAEQDGDAPVISLLRRALVLEKAKSLARMKRYDEAVALVQAHPSILQSTPGREFLAKADTLRGDFVQARAHWLKILQEDPQHEEANRMVEAIDDWRARPSQLMKIAATSVVLIVMIALAAVYGVQNLRRTPPEKTLTPAAAVMTTAAPPSPASRPVQAPLRESPSPVIRFSLPVPVSETEKKN